MKTTELPALNKKLAAFTTALPNTWDNDTDALVKNIFHRKGINSTRKDRMALWWLVKSPVGSDYSELRALGKADPNMEGAPWIKNVGRAKRALGLGQNQWSEKQKLWSKWSQTTRQQESSVLPNYDRLQGLSEIQKIMVECNLDTISNMHLAEELEEQDHPKRNNRKIARYLRSLSLPTRRFNFTMENGIKKQCPGISLRDIHVEIRTLQHEAPQYDSTEDNPSIIISEESKDLSIDTDLDRAAAEAVCENLGQLTIRIKDLKERYSKLLSYAKQLWPNSFQQT